MSNPLQNYPLKEISIPEGIAPTITVASTSAGSGNLWVSSGTDSIDWSVVSDPTNWNASQVHAILSQMSIGGCTFSNPQPPPNAWHRFWQRAILGVTWKDLRPERDIETLKGLK
ncbi:MAG: hypothetical protein U1E51_06825 [Candidatus Binatia bacterium]|nr:hypothetical protein [Candidatus Binatia bacterium]